MKGTAHREVVHLRNNSRLIVQQSVTLKGPPAGLHPQLVGEAAVSTASQENRDCNAEAQTLKE